MEDVDEMAAAGPTYSISSLCAEFQVTPRTLRHYEAIGLLSPSRDGQRRIFGARDRARLKLILRGKRFGFRLEEIRELLDLYDVDPSQLVQLSRTVNIARGKLEVLESQRREIDMAIDDLKEQIVVLERMVSERASAKES